MSELLPCPFCGDTPELPEYVAGTQYEDLGCCFAYLGVQICDLMTIEERSEPDSWDNETFRYADKYVERAKQEAIRQWNTRAGYPRDLVDQLIEAVRKIKVRKVSEAKPVLDLIDQLQGVKE